MDKLEKLQERCLRFVFKDFTSSYDNLVNRANLVTLTLTRLRVIAIEVYKALKGHSPTYLKNLFIKRSPELPSIRAENTLQLPRRRSVCYGTYSLSYEGAKVWNHLPNNIRKAENLKHF